MSARGSGAPVTAVRASAYRIPTDAPEADGTFAWDATTLVLAETEGGVETGLGYTVGNACWHNDLSSLNVQISTRPVQ